ncbi:FHA domain-containing protein [Microbacterium sp.]|uniref:FHA domain-containing protein n=1 Tax=Microbacterium sp. TaxID=51671 RepID=UPI003A9224B5
MPATAATCPSCGAARIRPAGVGVRLAALTVDLAVVVIVAAAVALATRSIVFAAVAAVEVVLALWILQARAGTSIGNALVRVRVVRTDRPFSPGGGRALVRGLVSAAGLCVLVIGAWLQELTGAADRSGLRRTWADRAAGTAVLEVPRSAPGAAALPQQSPRVVPKPSAFAAQTSFPPAAAPASFAPPSVSAAAPQPAWAVKSQPMPYVAPQPAAPAQQYPAPVAPARPAVAQQHSAPVAQQPAPAQQNPAVAQPAPAQPSSTPAQPAPAAFDPAPRPALTRAEAAASRSAASLPAAAVPSASAPVPATPAPVPTMTVMLVFDTGQRELVAVPSAVNIGRSPSETQRGDVLIAVDDPSRTVSKTHARLENTLEGTWVTELGSTNGSALLDEDGTVRVLEADRRTFVEDGVRVRLGDRVITVTRLAGADS